MDDLAPVVSVVDVRRAPGDLFEVSLFVPGVGKVVMMVPARTATLRTVQVSAHAVYMLTANPLALQERSQ